MDPLHAVRARLAERLFERVAGQRGVSARDDIHGERGPRWFPRDAPVRRVQGDASMYVGGLRALLLQSLHPLPMAAVVDHSGFRSDPWGRLASTSTFLADTTFGTIRRGEDAIERVRKLHAGISGTAPDGRTYRADDPHLLRWVHVAEIDSFLTAHRLYGQRHLSAAEEDGYVAQSAHVARRLGADDVPTTVAGLQAALAEFRPELEGTPAARDVAQFLLHETPLSPLATTVYRALGAAAVDSLPSWAIELLGLRRPPHLPARWAGHVATGALRWVANAEPLPQIDFPVQPPD
ncbi:MAG TPA: oxygenase MpaB family protein [Segeticoccus sp.]|uniref:oxygenase MpaB family protein n=1 Tax=Segeticoccus sp. TaxID=2706531 RepID=UPI002D7F64FB|nr:oxygenase MpaB family protein [Segeticoccus sp.]HET8600168.1 oxygenase MpaB family protein [Segeticoccus sp.]